MRINSNSQRRLAGSRHLSIIADARQVSALLVGILLLAHTADAQDANAGRGDGFGATFARGDFNGDRFQDLAIGVPWEDVASTPWPAILDAGAVEVIYGTASGLAMANRQFWLQGALGLRDVAEAGDGFGAALTAGDFNADGFDDLAIGVPGESVGSVQAAGAVTVVYGSPSGLSTTTVPDQFWHQDSPDVLDRAESGDSFGQSLAVGYFNADLYADLVVGVPGENYDAGSVQVFYGSAAGLSAMSNRVFSQGSETDGLLEVSEASDYFGLVLAAGDFDCDGYDDLAIGVPYENNQRGAVHVVYGAPVGLRLVDNQFWDQDTPGVHDQARPGDQFGFSLATGDFNDDKCADLAVGVPGEDDLLNLLAAPGAVHVFYGSVNGFSWFLEWFIYQKDEAQSGDFFGTALTTGDFNGDGYYDLAIGVPGENVGWLDGIGPIVNAGAVNVIYGSIVGLSYNHIDSQFWGQDSPGVEDFAERDDNFGQSLISGDFNGDGRYDLAVGVHLEDFYGPNGSIENAGGVNVIYGSSGGLTVGRASIPDQFWTQIVILLPQP
jgi:hypothetical protein